jgi:hypothetical protein
MLSLREEGIGLVSRHLSATAPLEAGHAVTAVFLQVPFRRVTIQPSEGNLGQLVHKIPKWFRPDLEATPRIYIRAESHIIISFAGQVAEAKYRGKRPHFGYEHDHRNAVDMAMRLCGGSEKTINAYLRYLHYAAEDHVNIRWNEIKSVASELLKRGTLSGNEVRELIFPGSIALAAKLVANGKNFPSRTSRTR